MVLTRRRIDRDRFEGVFSDRLCGPKRDVRRVVRSGVWGVGEGPEVADEWKDWRRRSRLDACVFHDFRKNPWIRSKSVL